LAPWWLRSKKEDTPEDDEFGELAGDGVLDLLGTEEDDDEEDDEEEAYAVGWEEASHEPDEGREPEEEPKRHAASEDDDSAAQKKKRKRKRRKKKSAEDDEPAERGPAERASAEHAERGPAERASAEHAERGPAERASAEHAERGPAERDPAERGPAERASRSRSTSKASTRPARQEAPRERSRTDVERPTKDEIVFDLPERIPMTSDEERKIALFCDLENIALGVRNSEIKKFDITLVLERLLEKGKIIVKRAYADWERYSEFKRAFHEAAIELIDIPQKRYSGKNSADIKMVVDAMDFCFTKEHLDTFVLLSGDSDFSPLVSKLKENNKYVIGMGVKNSTSNLLIDNCDEFIYYEDVWRDLQRAPRLDHLSEKEAEVFGLLIDSILALVRENKSILWGSMIKQTMQRKRPSFSEGYYSYSSFSDLLEDAQSKSIIRLKRDPRSGNYAVTGFGG